MTIKMSFIEDDSANRVREHFDWWTKAINAPTRHLAKMADYLGPFPQPDTELRRRLQEIADNLATELGYDIIMYPIDTSFSNLEKSDEALTVDVTLEYDRSTSEEAPIEVNSGESSSE